MMCADGKHEGQTFNDFISLCVHLCHLRFTSEIFTPQESEEKSLTGLTGLAGLKNEAETDLVRDFSHFFYL
jgi:hypothetical protein